MFVLTFSFSSSTPVWHYKKIIFWQYQGEWSNQSEKSLSVLKQHLHSFSNGNAFFSWYKVCLLTSSQLFSSICISMQAWLTEIHEYAQKDVVIMLLGNKVSGTSWGGAIEETSLKAGMNNACLYLFAFFQWW